MYPKPQLFVIFPRGAPAISIGPRSLAYFSASGLCLRWFLPVIDSANWRGKHLPSLGCDVAARHTHACQRMTSPPIRLHICCLNTIRVSFFFFPHMQLTFPIQDSSIGVIYGSVLTNPVDLSTYCCCTALNMFEESARLLVHFERKQLLKFATQNFSHVSFQTSAESGDGAECGEVASRQSEKGVEGGREDCVM